MPRKHDTTPPGRKQEFRRPRKRDTSPEGLLSALIAAIEMRGDDPSAYHADLERLLTDGPLRCEVTEPEATGVLRAELMAFLESVVRAGDRPSYGRIALFGRIEFRGYVADHGQVTCAATGTARDLAILQLIVLLQLVGLRNVHPCGRPECRRLFVKTWRREYCSVRCQQTANKRKQRQNKRAVAERRRLRQRRNRAAS